jgi:hypothetical protein
MVLGTSIPRTTIRIPGWTTSPLTSAISLRALRYFKMWAVIKPVTRVLRVNISLSTQCNFMKQTAKSSLCYVYLSLFFEFQTSVYVTKQQSNVCTRKYLRNWRNKDWLRKMEKLATIEQAAV